MFGFLGRWCASFPWIVCAAWLVLGSTLTSVAPAWDTQTQDDDVLFLPDRCTSVRAHRILEKAFPQDVFASRLIFVAERRDTKLTKADFRLVDAMVDDLRQLAKQSPDWKIGSIRSYEDPLIGSRLTSSDGHCTLVQVSLQTPFLALQTRDTVAKAKEVLRERMARVENPPHVYATGQAGIGHDLLQATGSSLEGTTWATILLVICVLLLVYRSPVLALIPLLTIAISVWVSLKLLALLTLLPGVHLVNVSKVFVIVISYGAGTDYCLFLISRYREALEQKQGTMKAVGESVGAVGGALTASAGTVMCGLGLMSLAEFAKVRYSGPGIALSLAVGLIACLTLTPALLRLLGRVAFWPGRPPEPRPIHHLEQWNHRKGIWEWISRRVVAKPGWILGGSLLLLAPLALLGTQVTPDYRVTSQLSPDSESSLGLSALKRHFQPGETGPLTVLLVTEADWDNPRGHLQIDHLSRGFANLENVAEVRSLTQPLGRALPDPSFPPKWMGWVGDLAKQFRLDGLTDGLRGAQDAARQHYLSEMVGEDEKRKHVTRLDVIFESDPFDAETKKTMEWIRFWLKSELPDSKLMSSQVDWELSGVMVSAHDLQDVTESDRWRVNTSISVAIFFILLLIVRSPLMALYLLVTVLFSYTATLGATMLMGYVWTGSILYQLDWRVMFFLFTILVAVGEDYNILLMDRARQDSRRHGAIEGMRRALARTGGTITSCGLIMAGTFATLMLTNLTTLLQIGFALAFGVLMDTFVVRPFLVPSFAILLGRRAEGNQQPAETEPEDRPEVLSLPIPEPMRKAG